MCVCLKTVPRILELSAFKVILLFSLSVCVFVQCADWPPTDVYLTEKGKLFGHMT